MSPLWRRFALTLAWLITRVYYRSFKVIGAANVPPQGPVLLVVNHPNSVLDAGALISAIPRAVRFGAKEPLFHNKIWGPILRGTGGIPIHRRQDKDSDPTRNQDTYSAFVAGLHAGDVCAIFPEGFSHLEPRLGVVKAGAAKIALVAQQMSGAGLMIPIVPVGLSFRPEQAFRGDAYVNIGQPFTCEDVAARPFEESIPVVQQRIRDAIEPLMIHMERPDLAPLVHGVARAYRAHQKAAGREVASRPESERIASLAFNHFLATDPAVIDEVRRRHDQYVELAGDSKVREAALRVRGHKRRWFLTFIGLFIELILGFPIFAIGFVVSLLPVRLTEYISRRYIRTGGGEAALPVTRVVVGGFAFLLFYGVIGGLFHDWSQSHWASLAFIGILVACTMFMVRYRRHARAWYHRLLALSPAFIQRKALAAARESRSRLVWYVHQALVRYQEEAGEQVLPTEAEVLRKAERRQRMKILVRRALLVAGVVAAFFVIRGCEEAVPDQLVDVPSPWMRLPADQADLVVERDALALAGYLDALDTLDQAEIELREDFREGRRDYYTPADDLAIHMALARFLHVRQGLVRIAWYYRETPDTRDDDATARALVLAHTATVELCAREMQFIDTFGDDDEAKRKLNEADPARGVPPRMFNKIRARLGDRAALEALAAGSEAFAELDHGGKLPRGEPWERLAREAERGARVVEQLSERVVKYKVKHSLRHTVNLGEDGIYKVSAVVSTWIGDARVRQRPGDGGLISEKQVEDLRRELRPGDILIERRNWYLSNAFLPGFWPHSALYIGSRADIEKLGLHNDERVSPHVSDLDLPDPHGGERVVIESISDGVVFTSLEYSVGGADAVCVLRPLLPQATIDEAIARAFSHLGKPYDFDFDFFSTDKLVCTEVIHQAYGKSLDFELVEIMDRKTLPALQIVRRWVDTKDDPEPLLELVAFLDADEDAGTAVASDADTLVETLDRPGMTLLEERKGRPRFLSTPVLVLAGLVLLTLLVTRRE